MSVKCRAFMRDFGLSKGNLEGTPVVLELCELRVRAPARDVYNARCTALEKAMQKLERPEKGIEKSRNVALRGGRARSTRTASQPIGKPFADLGRVDPPRPAIFVFFFFGFSPCWRNTPRTFAGSTSTSLQLAQPSEGEPCPDFGAWARERERKIDRETKKGRGRRTMRRRPSEGGRDEPQLPGRERERERRSRRRRSRR